MTVAFRALLCAARDGDKQAAGALLERYRSPLHAAAAAALPPELKAKLSASDLVQRTFLDAQRRLDAFQGESPEMLAAWLRAALLNKLRDELRRFSSPGRTAAAEVSLDADSRMRKGLASESSGPFEKASRAEEQERLSACLAGLPPNYQEAILLRHRDNLSFGEMALRLTLSENAARKLWVRAIAELRKVMSR
jgi:RNA polymerase sigma-70 factor, ECF subfamily